MTDIEDGQGEWLDQTKRLWLLQVPRHVRNPSTYYDRTVQDWHRRSLGQNSDAIDLDLVGYCHDWRCRQILYVIEAAEADTKATSVATSVAQSCGAVALLIIHQRREVLHGRRVHPLPTTPWMPPDQLIRYMEALRSAHKTHAHGQPKKEPT